MADVEVCGIEGRDSGVTIDVVGTKGLNEIQRLGGGFGDHPFLRMAGRARGRGGIKLRSKSDSGLKVAGNHGS